MNNIKINNILPSCKNVNTVGMETDEGQEICNDGYLESDTKFAKQQKYLKCELQNWI